MKIRIIITLNVLCSYMFIIQASQQGDCIVWDKVSASLLRNQDIYTFASCVIPSYFAHETDTARLRIDTVETVYHTIDWSKYTLTEGRLEKDSPVAGQKDRYKLIPTDQRLMPLYFEYQEESSAFQASWLPKPTVFLSVALKYYWDKKRNCGYFVTKMQDDPQGGHYRALVSPLKSYCTQK